MLRLKKNSIDFPDPKRADDEGLLAYGGDLKTERLKAAYRLGIFPWYSEDQPILWWSPNPRFVMRPSDLKVAKSLRPFLRKEAFEVRFNTNFEQVLLNCQNVSRSGQAGTWITDELIDALQILHQENIAISVETYQNGELVGGLFGELYGGIFFGESMFSLVSNASKIAYTTLVQNLQRADIKLIDCQVHTPYLESLGATMISRVDFMAILDVHFEDESKFETIKNNWQKYTFED